MPQTIDLNDTTPAAPADYQLNLWQADAPDVDQSVIRKASNYTPIVTAIAAGSVPKIPSDATKFFCGDGTWKVAGGGSKWYEGSGAPGGGTGIDGDFYLNMSNGDVYEKATGAWGSSVGNIKGPTGAAGAAGTDGTIAGRANVTLTTGSIAAGSYESGSFALAKSFAIIALTVDRSCRVRFYSTAAHRDADVARGTYAPPLVNTSHGVICDFVLDGSALAPLSNFICSPEVYGANGDPSPTSDVYYTITNNTASAHTVQATFLTKIEEA